jgi:hypothetical protein
MSCSDPECEKRIYDFLTKLENQIEAIKKING